MSLDEIIQTISGIIADQTLIGKYILLIVLVLYMFFALILIRQIRLLTGTVNQIHFSLIFVMLAALHALVTVVLLVATILV